MICKSVFVFFTSCIWRFDTLIGFDLFWFAKCQNEKCRQKAQNRGSGGTFLGVFRGVNGC